MFSVWCMEAVSNSNSYAGQQTRASGTTGRRKWEPKSGAGQGFSDWNFQSDFTNEMGKCYHAVRGESDGHPALCQNGFPLIPRISNKKNIEKEGERG